MGDPTPYTDEELAQRAKRPSFAELYERWEAARDTQQDALQLAAGHHAHGLIAFLRPHMVALQRELDEAADELFFQVLLAEKGQDAARREFGLRCRNGGHWDAGEEDRIS